MADRWEALAQADAEFYICTELSKGEDFFASGERDAEHILSIVGTYVGEWKTALEIGCGVGRLTLPISRRFERITAVDIAPTMLRKLDENCRARGVNIVTSMLAGERWELGGPVDLCYSRIVFQHIEPWSVITDYFKRIAACLTVGGVFYVQFDTRPFDVLYQIKNSLPDIVLPRTKQRGVRRIRRTAAEIQELARASGLECMDERGAGTFDTEFVFQRSALVGNVAAARE
ncbi:MAG TPA: class I SAM-dependent methyltransferase [Gemmatimonadaceae bacterium]|nr:class I SAM-dependent methyltransferase [Gemmatimonadaceae bacterium]